MSRKDFIDSARLFAPGNKLTQPMVDLLDKVADLMGYPRSVAGVMEPSQAAIALMHEFEGLRLNAYRDPGSRDGIPITIGRGSTTDLDGKPIRLGSVWTREQADKVFARDLAKFAGHVRAALGNAPTTQSQFDALVSLAYNIGIGAFTGSTLLKLHKAGDYTDAQKAFRSWRFNDGKEMAGLLRRREAEAKLYGGG